MIFTLPSPRRVLALIALAVVIAALVPALAFAAPNTSTTSGAGSDLGKNVANLIQDWTRPLLVAVAGMMAFAAFSKRDSGRLVSLVLVTTVIGGFVFADDKIIAIIKGIWGSVA